MAARELPTPQGFCQEPPRVTIRHVAVKYSPSRDTKKKTHNMAPIVRVEILLGAASHIRTCGYHDLLALTRHAKKRKKLLQHDQKSRDVYTKNPSCEDTSSKSPELVPFPRKAFLKLSGMGREHTGKRAQIERFISSALATVEHEEALSWIRGESFHRESQADRQARQRAKALGQFFSSSKNAKALVEWTLDRMSSRNSKKKEINLASWWFLEPSAGSGMVFDALPQGFSKSAIELDPTLAVSRSFLPQDFLTTTRTTLHTSLKIPPNHPLCVIGNPPFSAPKPTHVTPRQESHSQGHARREAEKKGCMCGDFGRGLGSDIAEAFICHALCCLEADVVSYILPNRCAKEDFVLGVRKRCHGMRSKKLGPLLLRFANSKAADEKFDFVARVVSKPVVFQQWWWGPNRAAQATGLPSSSSYVLDVPGCN